MGFQLLRRFARDERAIEMDYMLSLFIFIISLAFTFIVLTQYLDLKHSEVDDVEERLTSLRVMDDLTGSPGWLSGRSDWEDWVTKVDLWEKVNDQSFFLGLRKNDVFYAKNIVIPGAGDGLLQGASDATISSTVESLRDAGVACIGIIETFDVVFLIDTLAENSSIVISGSADNATTHAGSLYLGSNTPIYVTDTRSDGGVRYDTVVISNRTLKEGSVANIGGRNFTVDKVDQERVLLHGKVLGGYILPKLDKHYYDLAYSQLKSAGVEFVLYSEIAGGGLSSIEYTLFSREPDKFLGQVTDLSIKKITSLKNDVPYTIAKVALGLEHDFHLRITRKRDGGVILDYGKLVPGDTERAEREVDVEGIPCTVLVDVWQV